MDRIQRGRRAKTLFGHARICPRRSAKVDCHGPVSATRSYPCHAVMHGKGSVSRCDIRPTQDPRHCSGAAARCGCSMRLLDAAAGMTDEERAASAYTYESFSSKLLSAIERHLSLFTKGIHRHGGGAAYVHRTKVNPRWSSVSRRGESGSSFARWPTPFGGVYPERSRTGSGQAHWSATTGSQRDTFSGPEGLE